MSPKIYVGVAEISYMFVTEVFFNLHGRIHKEYVFLSCYLVVSKCACIQYTHSYTFIIASYRHYNHVLMSI